MNQFLERYKALSNSDLLRIIENRVDYQQEAVKAAEIEFANRALSDQDLVLAKSQLESQKKEGLTQNKRKVELEGVFQSALNSFLLSINPIERAIPAHERQIRSITLIIGLIGIYRWTNHYEFIFPLFSTGLSDWGYGVVEFLVPMLLIPIATLLFALRKSVGWVLMAAYSMFTAITLLNMILLTRVIGPFETIINFELPKYLLFVQLAKLLFFCIIIWIISGNLIRDYYKIKRRKMFWTYGISAILTFVYISLLLSTVKNFEMHTIEIPNYQF